MLYRVWFECDDRIIVQTQMVYVAFPGHHVVLGEHLYEITDITWTPRAKAPDYVLSVSPISDAPAWAA